MVTGASGDPSEAPSSWIPPTSCWTSSAPLILITCGPPVPTAIETIAASRAIAPAPKSRRGTQRLVVIPAGTRRAMSRDPAGAGGSAGDRLVVAHGQPGQERFEALL